MTNMLVIDIFCAQILLFHLNQHTSASLKCVLNKRSLLRMLVEISFAFPIRPTPTPPSVGWGHKLDV